MTKPVPDLIRRWSWGGFFLTWIWGLGNSVWISLLALVPIVNLIVPFALGAKGNEWAWQARDWASVEEFQRSQRIWAIVGVTIFTITLIPLVIVGFYLGWIAGEQGLPSLSQSKGISFDARPSVALNQVPVAHHSPAAATISEPHSSPTLVAMSMEKAKTLEWLAYEGNSQDLSVLKSAAHAGNSNAQDWLGNYYGNTQHFVKGVYWYRQAARQGNMDAENNLGFSYQHGRGVEQNYAKAVRWFTAAAKQGEGWAENNLGVCYEKGLGVPVDVNQALFWFRKSASQGNQDAQRNATTLENDPLLQSNTQIPRNSAASQEEQSNSGPTGGRYTTRCNNMDCVRQYANGVTIHFVACMNPADMEPMINARVVDGQGECSGTDSDGNPYGVGSLN